MYINGIGVPKDYGKGLKWNQKAANQNDAQAQYNLGFIYKEGLGVVKDYSKVIDSWTKAANQNHAQAQYSLSLIHI